MIFKWQWDRAPTDFARRSRQGRSHRGVSGYIALLPPISENVQKKVYTVGFFRCRRIAETRCSTKLISDSNWLLAKVCRLSNLYVTSFLCRSIGKMLFVIVNKQSVCQTLRRGHHGSLFIKCIVFNKFGYNMTDLITLDSRKANEDQLSLAQLNIYFYIQSIVK